MSQQGHLGGKVRRRKEGVRLKAGQVEKGLTVGSTPIHSGWGRQGVPWEDRAVPNLEPSLKQKLREPSWGWQGKAGWGGQDHDLGEPPVQRLGGCPRPETLGVQGTGSGCRRDEGCARTGSPAGWVSEAEMPPGSFRLSWTPWGHPASLFPPACGSVEGLGACQGRPGGRGGVPTQL